MFGYHIILPIECQEYYETWFRTIAVATVHNEVTVECTLMGGTHIHVVGIPKADKRTIRDHGMDQWREMNCTGDMIHKRMFTNAKWVIIRTQIHMTNALKYVRKYTIILDNNLDKDFVKSYLSDKHAERSFEEEIAILTPEPLTADEYQVFRSKYPTENGWKRMLFKQKANKYLWAKMTALEKRAKEYELNLPVIQDVVDLYANPNFTEWFQYLSSLYIQDRATNDTFGKCVIYWGEAESFKSTTVRIIGDLLGGATIWPGSELLKQNDVLKWDSHVKSGNNILIIEEMKWYDPIKKITIRDTLMKIKELFIGDGIDVRTSKANNNMQPTEAPLQLKRLLITANEYPGANHKIIEEYLSLDESLARRIVTYNINQGYSSARSGIKVTRRNPKPEGQELWRSLVKQHTQKKLELEVVKFIKQINDPLIDIGAFNYEC